MNARAVDLRGLVCPLPVLKARKILLGMERGSDLRVLSSDPKSAFEFSLFCKESGHSLESATEHLPGEWEIIIRCA